MKVYTGNQTGQIPGELPGPYYWWEAGAMFGQLVNYWFLTGDTTYNEVVSQGIQFQVGANNDFMPQNQTKDLGNDDQVFWAFTAMDAAEAAFPDPPAGDPSWLALAQAVFNDQVLRWDTATCGGGLRWQIYPFNAGYDYKNTISSGGLFQLSARLARYTGNQTYADWAEKTYSWIASTPIIANDYQIWDGTSRVDNCSGATQTYWTYNVGTLISGAAYMYNYTNGSSTWQTRLSGLVYNGTEVFFVQSAGVNNNPPANAPPNGMIMAEVACEFPTPQSCDYDQPSFKAYLTRWLAITTQLASFTEPFIMPRLAASAQAAAAQCTGQGTSMCGRRWYQTVWDGFFGVGEQMSAMSSFQNLLIGKVGAPATAAKGGTSVGNPAAGGAGDTTNPTTVATLGRTVGTGDKVGAGILTALSLILIMGATSWMVI
ncbi:hydrolase 76 protein [Lambiella insularis]|nr:hydrolase 76 protein [Lambiella insularis]